LHLTHLEQGKNLRLLHQVILTYHLAADYFDLNSELTTQEKEFRAKLRGILESEVMPVVDSYYESTQFPKEFLVSYFHLRLILVEN